MLYKTTASEIVFWVLFIGMAFECNIHWSYLVLPGLISSIESLLTYNNKNQSNDD